MKKSKIYKIIFSLVIIATIGVLIFYFQLSTRHKAIVKTTLLHKIGILDNDWKVSNNKKVYQMRSPTFLIDGIYKSMEGPKASRYLQLSQKEKLLFMTGFKVKAIDSKTNILLSNDFICHMNVDINDQQYYNYFGLSDRIGKQYPRLTSLSNGLENFKFPVGFGIPIAGNNFLNLTTQTLNHNLPNIFKKLKHEINIEYEDYNKTQKPLLSKTVFIQLPYNKENPIKSPLDPASNQCIPVETKNHSYTDNKGNTLSGHWVIPVGEKIYSSSITNQLQIKDSLRLHFSAPHVHPFATNIGIYDKTIKKMLFNCSVSNYKNKIGLSKIETFSSQKGLWMYQNHDYELILTTNNTSNTLQDMMGSMFLFFYDKELNAKIAEN